MLGLTVKVESTFDRVGVATNRAAKEVLTLTAHNVASAAKSSIDISAESSPPGQPPHSRTGDLPESIMVDVAESAIIGPAASRVDDVGAIHEFGGEFRGEEFPAREFMLPAMMQNTDSFASDFTGSIGE